MVGKGQCRRCTGLCCRYFALPLDTPETKEDYDDIRWFLCHKGISVFVEDGDWYLSARSICRYLSEDDHRCLVYDRRPKICRKYKHSDCDFVRGEYDYELHFLSDKDMDEYIRIKFGNNVAEKRRMRNSGRKKSKA